MDGPWLSMIWLMIFDFYHSLKSSIVILSYGAGQWESVSYIFQSVLQYPGGNNQHSSVPCC
jgi:hypothetical protein